MTVPPTERLPAIERLSVRPSNVNPALSLKVDPVPTKGTRVAVKRLIVDIPVIFSDCAFTLSRTISSCRNKSPPT